MLPSETMIWQPEFTDKTLSRKTGAVHIDGTAAANPHSQLIIVSTATKRQRFQMKTFFLDQILIVTVVPHNLLSDEGLIFFYGAEVVTAPQYQRLTDTPFQMSVGTFNRAIFVAPTGIIVYALHSVVLTESSITLSLNRPGNPGD